MIKPKSAIHRLTRTSKPLTDNTLFMGTNGNETNAISLEEVKQYLGPGDTVNAIPLSQKGQPNGVPTLGSNGKIPSSQLPANGDGGGAGFIFEDLADYVSTVNTPSTFDYFFMGSPPTLTGNNVVGTLTANDNQSMFIAWFKVAAQTSYKVRLFPNTVMQFITTERKIDVTNTGPGSDPISDAGIKGMFILDIRVGTISMEMENQGIDLTFTPAAEDWLEITQTGTELILVINGEEVARTPQDPDGEWLNVLMTPTGDPEAPLNKFQYDLTNTLAGQEISLDIDQLSDMVIYRSSHALKILDRYVAVGDYVQLYEDKTKAIIYPQLSPIYDFDLSSPENQVIKPVQITNTNPTFILTPSEEENKGSISFPYQEIFYTDFADLSPETLENFHVYDQEGTRPQLSINQDFDPDGLLDEVIAEFLINKDYITSFSSSYSSFGNASSISFYFYAGAARDVDYLRLRIERYPTTAIAWYLCTDVGTESLIFQVTSIEDVRISLKDGLALKKVNTNSPLDTVTDTADGYTKYLDFTDDSDKITVRAVYQSSEEARTADPYTFSRPMQNLSITQQLIKNYTNLVPVEVDYATGTSTFKFDKEKSFYFYFISANSLSEVCSKIVASQTDLVKFLLVISYRSETDDYYYFMQVSGGNSSKNGTFTLGSSEELIFTLNKSPSSLQGSIAGNSVTATGGVKSKLFITDASMIFKNGILPAIDMEYDFSDVTVAAAINFESIRDRDRVRFVGGETTFNGKVIKSGDIVEFFNNKNEILITRAVDDADEAPIDLTVMTNDGVTTTDVKAWYEPATKRIRISGTVYISSYGGRILRISVPDSLQGRISNRFQVGFFAAANITQYVPPLLNCSNNGNELAVEFQYGGGQYMYGNVAIPDATIAIVN